jgi:hypothetical protein
MALDTDTMSDRGPEKAATPQEIFGHMKSYDRPVWTASSLADELGVSRPTIQDRLEEVEENPRVRTIQVGNTKAYYVSEEDPRPIEEQHKDSIIDEFTDKFVGLPTAPWTAVHPNDGPAEAGDKVQIRVEGVPGRWRQQMTHTWESRRQELIYEETSADETQALISGELYAKPTVPIEHTNYPDDYDLELNIGGEYQEIEERSRPILIVAGVKNYLVKPCNDAVFLKDVSVDWMSPKEHGQELETFELTHEMVQGEEEREEAVEARDEHKHSDSPEDVEAEQPGLEFVEQMLDAAEPAEGWLKNIIGIGAISLDEETVDLLVNHENSPVDSEEELRDLVEEVAEEWGGEEDDEQ